MSRIHHRDTGQGEWTLNFESHMTSVNMGVHVAHYAGPTECRLSGLRLTDYATVNAIMELRIYKTGCLPDLAWRGNGNGNSMIYQLDNIVVTEAEAKAIVESRDPFGVLLPRAGVVVAVPADMEEFLE